MPPLQAWFTPVLDCAQCSTAMGVELYFIHCLRRSLFQFSSLPLSSPLLPPVRCKQQVDAYIAAKREDARLSVGGDLRKINHCFKLLKVSCVCVCTCVCVQESVLFQHDNHEYLVLRPCWVIVVYPLVTGESAGAIEGPSAEPDSGVRCAHITCL